MFSKTLFFFLFFHSYMCAQGQRSRNESILHAIMESVHKKHRGEGWHITTYVGWYSRNEMQERNFVICHRPDVRL